MILCVAQNKPHEFGYSVGAFADPQQLICFESDKVVDRVVPFARAHLARTFNREIS